MSINKSLYNNISISNHYDDEEYNGVYDANGINTFSDIDVRNN
jgi:hypothetical protein